MYTFFYLNFISNFIITSKIQSENIITINLYIIHIYKIRAEKNKYNIKNFNNEINFYILLHF